MALSNWGFIDLQATLSAALVKKDIRLFVEALDSGAQAALQDDRHTCIYEKALSTPGCWDFIEACIDHGCQVNYINQKLNKAAVNYAADSRDPGNLAALLRDREGAKVRVDRKYAQLTPLNSLAKNLTEDNASDVLSCIKLLLDYGASPNLIDQADFTPLHHVLRKSEVKAQKRELVQLFVNHPELDIDSHRNGEVRRLLEDQFPELGLPKERLSGTEIDVQTLRQTLLYGEESLFKTQFAEYLQSHEGNADNQEEFFSLLRVSVKQGKHNAFEAIIASGIDINWKPGKTKEANIVELAVICGNWQALERLLKEPNLRLDPKSSLLNAVIGHLEERPCESSNHQRCFDLLLNNDCVDVNEADTGRQVPLSYAVKYRNTTAIQKLLKHGAYIGSRSVFGTLPIKDMQPEVLEEHFNSCITTNGKRPGELKYEINIDFKNLIRQERDIGVGKPAAPSNQLHDEMAPIAFIAETKELRHLLHHPVISSFLFLKWHRLSVIFYVNFLLYCFFTASIITHTLLKFHASDHRALTALFLVFSCVGIGYLIIREGFQFMMFPVRYILSITNIMEVALIILSICTCIESNFDKETKRVLAVFTILLVSIQFCLLVGSLPVLSISTHMRMLREVLSSFLKFFALYSIFVLTFSLCFHILFSKPIEEGGAFNTFTKPIEALIKTIVMLTGEFDAGDIKFTSFYTYLIFLLFVFFMAIVLFNLLNGLAVSDTQVIKAQAELNGAICRTQVLSRYEHVLTAHGRAGFLMEFKLFRTICQRLMNVYPNYLSLRQIIVLPNDGRQVIIPTNDSFEKRNDGRQVFIFINNSCEMRTLEGNSQAGKPQKKFLDPPLKLLTCCCSGFTGRCSQMDVRTVKMALAVIDQKNSAAQRRKKEQINDNRMKLIERQLEQLIQLGQERN
ncbi:transient receptor potential cation channel protein painless-like isoform X2 [Drosophila rhopaloa]|uniref:Ion transport domain-containing protein n=2 Tax=Drosophila rhopaloa TaxID=1041015 RepID=A0ABM5JE52_DRORH|nr:transient receptor potential cation channel protein painless-like isoform X2 [Drosophila rhopaloa]XP_044317100.1 transient receptor potential cation channel protein painless-like isoform X2 [Drosophila rhopaloa]